MNDLVTSLREADYDTPYLFDLCSDAADHIKAQEKLIEEMREALQEGYAHISETARLMAARGLRPDYPSLNLLCGNIADAISKSKSNPNTPERNDE